VTSAQIVAPTAIAPATSWTTGSAELTALVVACHTVLPTDDAPSQAALAPSLT